MELNGLKLDKLEKINLFFQIGKLSLEKIAKYYYVLLSVLNFISYLLRDHDSAGVFCVPGKVLSNDFSTELT